MNLDSRLIKAIAHAGYSEPTKIQAEAIPLAIKGCDLIGTAQTGTGKTAAFALPILNKLLSGPVRRTRALIVTPTRELAAQIQESFRMFAKGTPIRCAAIYGGVGAEPQIQAFRNGFEVIVACPGRLLDLVQRGCARLDDVEVLVIDEADRMFDMGFLPDLRRVLKLVPSQRQTMLFSATFPAEIEKLAREALRSPKRVEIGLTRPANTVKHALFPVFQSTKTPTLLSLLKKTAAESVLIFARTRHRTRRLARQIQNAGYRVTSLHSDRTQQQRQTALAGFRQGRYQIMVATDIAARGLDVEGISHVINYDMPDSTDAYIHRIGRTGRAERNGDAFTLVTPDDGPMVEMLERVMGERLMLTPLAEL